MPATMPSFVPSPRSYRAEGPSFPVAVLVLSADAAYVNQARALRDEIASVFGERTLAPLNSEADFAWAKRYEHEGSELWGGNFKPASALTVPLRLSRDPSPAFAGAALYAIDCASGGIEVRASTAELAAAACATLVQLLHFAWDGWRFILPTCTIEDAPAFSWRGLMIDSARHFVPLDAMKRLVRLAWLYKIDRLHWHLSDDQGWRIELLNTPQATASGSTRGGGDPNRNGYYTQEDVRSLVAFAADRGITVVPELDLPGHVQAVLAGDPDLACTPGPHAVRTAWGISEDVLCMGNLRSLQFALAAWDEVCELFPGPYVHIGGDECPTTRWEQCPRCAARKRELGLADWVDLHGRFVADVTAYLESKGKTVFGWDEVLDSKVKNDANVVHWRAFHPERGAEALAAGKDLIRSPSFPYYLDFVQAEDRSTVPGLAHNTRLAATLRRVYEFDPYEGLPADAAGDGAATAGSGRGDAHGQTARGRYLGVQANAWSEFLCDPRRIDYMLFPRLLAVAETAWLGNERPGWDDFLARLRGGHRRILDRLAVNYCPIELDTPAE